MRAYGWRFGKANGTGRARELIPDPAEQQGDRRDHLDARAWFPDLAPVRRQHDRPARGGCRRCGMTEIHNNVATKTDLRELEARLGRMISDSHAAPAM